jgi:hypothetical protein
MAEFLEGVADRNGLLAVDKEDTHFGLGGRGHDLAEDVAGGVEGAVVGRLSRFVAGIEVAASAATYFGLGKIGGITLDI